MESSRVANYKYGDIFVIRTTSGNLNGMAKIGELDTFLVKYNSNGELLLTRIIGLSGVTDGKAVAVDQNGNIFVAGYTPSNLNGVINNGSNDGYLVKFNTNGELLWTKLIGSSQHESFNDVVVDQEYIYLSGYFRTTIFHNISNKGELDGFLIELST